MPISMDQRETGPSESTRDKFVLGNVARLVGGVSTSGAADSRVHIELKFACQLAYTVEELAGAVSVSRSTLYEAINDGSLIARRVGDRRTVITLIDAITWLQECPPVRKNRTGLTPSDNREHGPKVLPTRHQNDQKSEV